ncbi:MAG: hypothetical protein J0L94_08080 [Rhodothermia bacterium]|nr:hypothetical protein [Rhodothermia bacterium]
MMAGMENPFEASENMGNVGLYPYLMPLVFWLSFAIGVMAILLFLKLGIYGLPALFIALFVQVWVLAINEMSGFPRDPDGFLREQFRNGYFFILVLMLVLLFFTSIMALMGN